ncbi:type IV secretory system conjugative DNA transfer family protein [Methylovulum miyakonense]|uniref:type IV secretory system conjugative DNA transfer family protein n=1 Tax=Methylovulum miyakonense TaxID=645578 RepID=UPI0012EB37AF
MFRKENFAPILGNLPRIGSCDTASLIFARTPSTAYFSNNDDLPDGNGHILTIAPTRAGKGSGQIIPNLLSWIFCSSLIWTRR